MVNLISDIVKQIQKEDDWVRSRGELVSTLFSLMSFDNPFVTEELIQMGELERINYGSSPILLSCLSRLYATLPYELSREFKTNLEFARIEEGNGGVFGFEEYLREGIDPKDVIRGKERDFIRDFDDLGEEIGCRLKVANRLMEIMNYIDLNNSLRTYEHLNAALNALTESHKATFEHFVSPIARLILAKKAMETTLINPFPTSSRLEDNIAVNPFVAGSMKLYSERAALFQG